ncbi:nucleoporin Nup43 [Ischnura elegans]|uniref:nucleoporin Nup43 n=1 Tax=Ischnura elegans TaxID=197161 RepID=UPI001ED89AAD|nr:nucleoporin Nup43 [Ischnura elegans]
MAGGICGNFVSKKVNKVRWKPRSDLDVSGADTFISGSWDDSENELALWQFSASSDQDGDLIKLTSLPHYGDVTELKFINSENFVSSSSFGNVKLFRLAKSGMKTAWSIIEELSWDKLHHFDHASPWEKCSCTAFASYDEDIVTVGEDGRMVLLTAHQRKPVRIMDGADSCSLHCVCFLKYNQVITGNLRGQLKVWDFGVPNSHKPVSTFMLSGDQVTAMCITQHPTQRHVVLVGGEDGSLTAWDLRQSRFPVTLLNAHPDAVNEVKFHPMQPEHLFTCSASGELWHWNTSAMSTASSTTHMGRSGTGGSISEIDGAGWLGGEASKHRLEVFSLIPAMHKPINSLDVDRDSLVYGCDNEGIYLLTNITL